MKKVFIRIDIFRGIFTSKPLDTLYQLVNDAGERK